MIKYHTIAFLTGCLLDLLIGDPHNIPHPICMIGNWISGLEKRLLRADDSDSKKTRRGLVLVIRVLIRTIFFIGIWILVSYAIHPIAGICVEAIFTCYALAMHSLKAESMKVYKKLKYSDLPEARVAVSMIVGRDTENLTEEGVIKATVETIAENTSDGVIAPMLYLAIGGPIFGFVYKAINTMDSCVGYKNDKYLYFGRRAAKLDDIVNFLPARFSAVLMIFGSIFLGKDFSARHGAEIFRRDRFCHASPNSAQTEAVIAGVLGVQLAGDTSYFGKIVKKPTIGDNLRRVEKEDIVRANRLLYMTGFLCGTLCGAILIFLSIII